MDLKNRKWLAAILVVFISLAGCGKNTAASDASANQAQESVAEKPGVDAVQQEHTAPMTDEKDQKQEPVMPAVTVNTASLTFDTDGILTSWHQYTYNEEGVRVSEFVYDVYTDEFSELTYNEQGQMTSQVYRDRNGNAIFGYLYDYDAQGDLIALKSYDPSESAQDQSYTYEKDENGRVLVQHAAFASGEPLYSVEYSYDADGKLAKTLQYDPLGQLLVETLYDRNGNQIQADYPMEEAHWCWEYDEHGNLVQEWYISPMEGGETTIQYTNHYDAQGNLIAVDSYNKNGILIGQTLNPYAPADDYTLDELQEQAELIRSSLQEDLADKETEHFVRIEEKIRNDETAITFGYRSARFRQLKSVTLDKFGQDATGRFCRVKVRYDSAYGEYLEIFDIHYVITGTGELQLTACTVSGGHADNPTVDVSSVMEPFSSTFLFYNSYLPVVIEATGSCSLDRERYYGFAGDGTYVSDCKLYSYGTAIRFGEATTDPCDLEGCDFVLRICWEDGLCETHYGRLLDENFIISIGTYDEKAAMVLGKYYAIDAIDSRRLARAATAE